VGSRIIIVRMASVKGKEITKLSNGVAKWADFEGIWLC
jgi:hypothetical protein